MNLLILTLAILMLANAVAAPAATAAPYTFTWNNVASGVYSLSAKAISSVSAENNE